MLKSSAMLAHPGKHPARLLFSIPEFSCQGRQFGNGKRRGRKGVYLIACLHSLSSPVVQGEEGDSQCDDVTLI